MNYFKNTKNEIFAFDDEQLTQVSEYNNSPSKPETDIDETVKYKEYYPQSVVTLAEKVNELTEITEAEKDELLAPTQEQLDAKRIAEIDSRLKEIDVESVRPLRAINAGTDTQLDRDKLAELDAEAEALRAERAGLV